MDISVAEDRVLDDGDTLHDGTDSVGPFLRIRLPFEQQVGLELDEVLLVLFDIFLEILRRMGARELVGILAAGEEEHTEAHTLGEQHVGTTQGGGCRLRHRRR